jgi:transposase
VILEALIPGEDESLPAQRKYPEELRERAVKMVFEVRDRDGEGRGEIARLGRQLGVHPELGVRELHRANEILKAASAYFAWELDPRHPR